MDISEPEGRWAECLNRQFPHTTKRNASDEEWKTFHLALPSTTHEAPTSIVAISQAPELSSICMATPVSRWALFIWPDP
ncbi:hypothetical protein POX_b03198 [Penicillium oxalicum]|uniref:Uncharacterized protein n=1 Tax=Penicillium oxalicum (strain 114-2 / CGMCC 5302) TaxID=933388 RepID=S7ZHP1_PENO1|nr:hypothetical protein POX_b03198 [Penicillium oxalicum]EPS29779.1 hypothetical protein PDE_04729 [Penicillium oxalicum 114-2]KAI2793148.1 hypothetical protein POX_b03198 [Penicillium oxalicum]